MASLEEVYAEVLTNEDTRAAFVETLKTENGLQAFLDAHGCESTPEEVKGFLDGLQAKQGKISDAELEAVEGGRGGGSSSHSSILVADPEGCMPKPVVSLTVVGDKLTRTKPCADSLS